VESLIRGEIQIQGNGGVGIQFLAVVTAEITGTLAGQNLLLVGGRESRTGGQKVDNVAPNLQEKTEASSLQASEAARIKEEGSIQHSTKTINRGCHEC
jgi:hypothetical protein